MNWTISYKKLKNISISFKNSLAKIKSTKDHQLNFNI